MRREWRCRACPGIIVGHNQRIAWGITNLQFDVQDLYLEQFDERTGRYLYRGQIEQARREREIIGVKGQAIGGGGCLGDAPRPADFEPRQRARGAALDGGRAGHAAIPDSGYRPRRRTGSNSPPRSGAFPGRARISYTPTWTATSAITPRASCPSGTDTRETFRWMARRATSNGTASSRSTSLPAASIRRAA